MFAGSYLYTTYINPDFDTNQKVEDIKQALGLGDGINRTAVELDGVVTLLDSQGNRFDYADIEVTITDKNASTVFRGNINSNSEVILRNVFTWTLYNVSVIEKYGKSRIYPLTGETFMFEGNITNANIVVQERAFLRDLNVESDTGHLYDDRMILDSEDGRHIILFDLKAAGQGIVKSPKLRFTDGDIERFDAWIWIYNTNGLELPEELQKGKVKFGENYTFENLNMHNGMKMALQIEKASAGMFILEISDSDGLEKKSKKFEVV
ncbi:MAG: hypothetical protein V3U02_12435 [Calditrichia bacterium]